MINITFLIENDATSFQLSGENYTDVRNEGFDLIAEGDWDEGEILKVTLIDSDGTENIAYITPDWDGWEWASGIEYDSDQRSLNLI